MSDLSEAFGSEWEEKYQGAISSNKRQSRLNVTGAIRKEIIRAVKSNMKPESPQLMYPRENDYYHVVLVKSYPELKSRELSWGVGINFRWGSKWISATMPGEIAQGVKTDTNYVLVGKLIPKEGRSPGMVFNNFSVHGIISMEELAAYKDDGEEETDGEADEEPKD